VYHITYNRDSCDSDRFPAVDRTSRMDAALQAGIAIYNAGEYHAAHDAWEATWLELDRGCDDERFLHGLIQFTAAVYHARNRNWSGCLGLCDSAIDYFRALPSTYRGVDLLRVRSALETLKTDPEQIERRPAPALYYQGTRLTADTLSLEALSIAANTIASEYGYDSTIVADASSYAKDEAVHARSKYAGLLTEFILEGERRSIVFTRLSQHVDRERAKADDVCGLFK